MGVTGSQTQEGDHFHALVKAKLNEGFKISPRARILKTVSFSLLWENFLSGVSSSFALTHAEATTLLLDSLPAEDEEGHRVDFAQATNDVKSYLTLVEELSHQGSSIDVMSLCSSALLLSRVPIEIKADLLFSWILLDPEASAYSFDDFFLAMKSFERGLSHAMGHAHSSEGFVKGVATQWLALADPQHRGSADTHTRISAPHFFEFCTNRQHVVRYVLSNYITVCLFIQLSYCMCLFISFPYCICVVLSHASHASHSPHRRLLENLAAADVPEDTMQVRDVCDTVDL
jgi:hypothetical protein